MSAKDKTPRESNRNVNKRPASPSRQERPGGMGKKQRARFSDNQKVEPDVDQENMGGSYQLDLDILKTELADDWSDCYEAEASSFREYPCDKKNHDEYVPIDELSFPTLPETYDSEDIESVVGALRKLVVKIVVRHSSPKRPKVFTGTNTEFPKGPCRGTGKIIFSERKWESGHEWGEIKIATSRHVVFDQSEAEHTTCILNFDNEDSDVIELKCSNVKYASTIEDNCVFICKTDNMTLVKQLRNYIYDFIFIHEELYEKYRHVPQNDLVLMVSHPHGQTKKVSIGSCADPNTNTYKLASCKGSSGAPIYRLNQKKVWVLELHSLGGKEIAVSGIKV
ncbi:unnamed protein product [Lymnaea stagnalis]|uniref:Uncharacterized protein n=1 Tax=Lymnaea stagnalis TaxID=6523 RepID=A0AAV2HHB4_LYMST